jgi:hypothetical protein
MATLNSEATAKSTAQSAGQDARLYGGRDARRYAKQMRAEDVVEWDWHWQAPDKSSHDSMNDASTGARQWDESPSAAKSSLNDNPSMFQLLFERSTPFQPNGESSAVLSRKYIQECMANGSARCEWLSCTPQGRGIPLEVTLTRIQWS